LPVQIPLIVGNSVSTGFRQCLVHCEVLTNMLQIDEGFSGQQLNPSQHKQKIAEWTPAGKSHVQQAIEAALAAKPAWEDLPFEDRAAVFLRAAELVTGKYRYEIIAATMLGQGKNIWQAEIDAAAETADLFRYFSTSFKNHLAHTNKFLRPMRHRSSLSATSRQSRRCLEPPRIPPPRRLRLRHLPL
jgi:acyl-CoA reductase-like NAD-dependent aldehyde dehydrogenase